MDKLFDLSEFEALAMGDTDFIKELLAANVESIDEGIISITKHFEEGNLDGAGQAAHKIKPLLDMLKAGDVLTAAKEIEFFSRKEFDAERVRNAYAIFAAKAPILLQQLKELL